MLEMPSAPEKPKAARDGRSTGLLTSMSRHLVLAAFLKTVAGCDDSARAVEGSPPPRSADVCETARIPTVEVTGIDLFAGGNAYDITVKVGAFDASCMTPLVFLRGDYQRPDGSLAQAVQISDQNGIAINQEVQAPGTVHLRIPVPNPYIDGMLLGVTAAVIGPDGLERRGGGRTLPQ